MPLDTIVVFSPAPGPASGAVYTDPFTYADQQLQATANWTGILGSEIARVGIVSNRVTSTSTGIADGIFSFEGGTPANDQYAQIEFSDVDTSSSTGHDLGVCCRVTDGSNFYRVVLTLSGNLSIRKRTGGTNTTITSTTVTAPVVSDVLRIEVSGTTIRALVNGAEELSTTDSDHTSGKCGVSLFKLSSTTPEHIGFDNFECGDL